MSNSAVVLEASHLSKRFGGVRAVNDVSFSVHSGELLALIGPNGAGKSTCFNLINGQLKSDAGSVRLTDAQGKTSSITGLGPDEIWAKGVGRTFQVSATFSSMTVAENVQMALLSKKGWLAKCWTPARNLLKQEALALLALVGMKEQADRAASVLAYGDVKRLELALALSNEPRLLLMDEPTAGTAPEERDELMRLTRDVCKQREIGVLFTEHSMDVVFAYADRVIVLARGELIAQGSPQELKSNERVREVYFGNLL